MKLNVHTSHPSAFISSTFIDLRGEREAVAAILRKRGLNVNALDIKPASNSSSKKEILNGIKESDFVILVIGDRYGSILQSLTESETNSVTMWEYLRAYNSGKPVIAYFRNRTGNNSKDHDDPGEPAYKTKRGRFEFFKKLVTRRHNPAYFTTTSELSDKVDRALISIYRDGVKALLSENSNLSSKVVELESEISTLKSSRQSLGLGAPTSSPRSNALGGLSLDQPPQYRSAFLELLDKKT